MLRDPKHGVLGRIPEDIYPHLIGLFQDPEINKDFKFELSNVIAGMTKGAPTIGLRANLIYSGKDRKKEH